MKTEQPFVKASLPVSLLGHKQHPIWLDGERSQVERVVAHRAEG